MQFLALFFQQNYFFVKTKIVSCKLGTTLNGKNLLLLCLGSHSISCRSALCKIKLKLHHKDYVNIRVVREDDGLFSVAGEEML